MHSNSLGGPKIFTPSASVLHSLSHLTCISSLKVKNEQKTLIYTQLKISRYNPHFFAVWPVHTLPHFFLAAKGHFLTLEQFSTTEWPVLWMCVPYLQRYGPFKNGPSVGGSCGSASLFTDKHEVRATLSPVDLNKVTSFSHTKQLNIFLSLIHISEPTRPWYISSVHFNTVSLFSCITQLDIFCQ